MSDKVHATYTTLSLVGEVACGRVYLVEDGEGVKYALKCVNRARMERA